MFRIGARGRRLASTATLLVGLGVASSPSTAVDFTDRTAHRIVGEAPEAELEFSGITANGAFRLDFALDGKEIYLDIDPSTRRASIRSRGPAVTDRARLTGQETARLRRVVDTALAQGLPTTVLEGYWLRAMNLLGNWPVHLPVEAGIVDPQEVDPLAEFHSEALEAVPNLHRPQIREGVTSACDIPFPLGLSESLCWHIDEVQTADYIRLGIPLGEPVPRLKLFVPVICPEVDLLVGGAQCVGRCGKGCIGDGVPNNELNIYTQSCLNHDLCVGELSLVDPRCNQMFLYTIQDFFFGDDCL